MGPVPDGSPDTVATSSNGGPRAPYSLPYRPDLIEEAPPDGPAGPPAELSTEANRPAAVLVLDAEHGLRMALSLVRGWATLLDTKWDRLPEPVRREGIGVLRRRGEDVVAALEAIIERARAMAALQDETVEVEPDGHGELLRPAEAARMLAVSAKTVVRWASEGRLASTVTPGGHHRFRRDEVERVASEMQERRGRQGES